MWLAVWGFFAAFIFVFVSWTLLVLRQQKKAWAAFAKRNKLKYDAGTLMGSPTVTGNLNKRGFSLYTGTQQTADIRGQRYVTVIEFQLGQGMPTGAAIATNEYLAFLDGLTFDQSYDPELAEWKNDFILRTRDEKNLRAYLTKDRLQTLVGLFSMKGAAVLFFFDELEAVLRMETSDPLRNEAHLERIIKRISESVEKLTPTSAEKQSFKALIEDEKARRAAAAARVETTEEPAPDLDDVDLEGLDIDLDDDEEEIIIIKKRKPKKKAATPGQSAAAKNKKKKPGQSAKKE